MAGSESLREGAWAGKAAYLVGGGPSLKTLDFSLLRNVPRVLVVNRAFIDIPTADIFFTEDVSVITLFAEKLREFKGLKVFHALDPLYEADALKAVPDLHIIRKTRSDKFWAKSFSEGLSYSSNSSVGALNILDLLGADPIFLLGIDCRTDAQDYANYHNDYTPAMRVGKHQLESFASDFKHWAAHHLKHRTVVNLNKDSGVDCWMKFLGDYNEAIKRITDLSHPQWILPCLRNIDPVPPSPGAGVAGGSGVPAMEGE